MGSSPRLIGIGGPSGSGKSLLAAGLADRLGNCSVVSVDDFYRDLSDLDPELRRRQNFDHPDSVDRDLLLDRLTSLAAGESVELPIYDFSLHTRRSARRIILPRTHVIVEGLFALYWGDVRARFRPAVFVDAPDATCLARRVERDVRFRGRRPEKVRVRYEAAVRPMARRYVLPTRRYADLVLDGSERVEVNIERLCAQLS